MRIYLDSNVWIYLYESTAVEGQLARSLLKEAEQGGHTILASHHVLAEMLVVPIRFAEPSRLRPIAGPFFPRQSFR